MSDSNLLVKMIAKLDLNQLALQAAIEEVSVWIRERGALDVADNIQGALQVLTDNAEFMAQGIAELTVEAGIQKWQAP